ncbi:Oxysterol binding protein, variant [Aphelenchoides besseyi]|nr:Oxysterol binding protein, variant [Aphelenchoides besseyi]
MCRTRGRKVRQASVTSPIISSPIEFSSSEDQQPEKYKQEVEPPIVSPPTMSQRSESSKAPSSSGSAQNVPSRIELTATEREQPKWGDDNENFDAIYEQTNEQEIGNVKQKHGSVLKHLFSQVKPGMDLTKITLPTFILERRSLLEMYADFFAHPDDFVHATDLQNPQDRFIAVVRYYLSAFYPARKSGVAKKPYNPVLGETFRCRWTVPDIPLSGQTTKSGPFPGSDVNQQVSHHPPVSAFYAEHPQKKISLSAQIWTKSSFYGLSMSIGVSNIGNATLTLHEHGENYVCNFPDGYGRSILGKPWIELGGKVEIRCEETGYHADIEFLTKPMIGGHAHKIAGSVYKQNVRKPIMTLRGEWNGVIYAKPYKGKEELFTDVTDKPDVKKECLPIARQGDRESRRLWRHVTVGLYRDNIEMATSAKKWIEQRQRKEAQELAANRVAHKPKFFSKTNGDDAQWVFNDQLADRL